MRSFAAVWILCSSLCTLSAATFYGITDPYMAEYEGFWTAKSGTRGRMVAQIRPRGNNQYDGFVLLTRSRAPVSAFTLEPATLQETTLKFKGKTAKSAEGDLLPEMAAECELKDGKLLGTFHGELGEGTFEATKSERSSPTLGAAPPKHAIVLFDGEPHGWEKFTWKVTPEGAMEVTRGNIRAKEQLTNFKLHLEFRTPYMPTETGQARGNSGVYLQGKYEVQVLDSFGIYPLQGNDCSAIYGVRPPSLNATLPPMAWQTYDITYIEGNRAAGEVPTISVDLNGVTVIDRAPIPAALLDKGTTAASPGSGFLLLQDHGNPVQYRNIWAEPFFSAAKKGR